MSPNNTNSDYKVDQGATEGDAEDCSLQAAQCDRPSNDGIRSKWNWYKDSEFQRSWDSMREFSKSIQGSALETLKFENRRCGHWPR